MDNYCDWCHQGNRHESSSPLSLFNSRPSTTCPACQRRVALIDIPSAGEMVRKSRKTIYQWINDGRVKTARGGNGRRWICYSSLFRRSDEEQ